MPRHLPAICLALTLLPPVVQAQSGASQPRLESDCLQRLRPLMGQGVHWTTVNFSALGNYAAYYVVTYRFTAGLANGQRMAACTYRRDGQWVRDDAAAHRLARELDTQRAGSPHPGMSGSTSCASATSDSCQPR